MSRPLRAAAALVVASTFFVASAASSAEAATYVPITGSGSTWSANIITQWDANVVSKYGMKIDYAAEGSSTGRQKYAGGVVDFAVSEIPYGLKDVNVVDYPPTNRPFGYMPIVAGGTAFMYNLKIGGKRVTELRLSGDVIAKIFTAVITQWNDPAIKAENPGLALPARRIVPVVRSDGSGTTAKISEWFAAKYASTWNAYCVRVHRPTPCGVTSIFPTVTGMVAQGGSEGVAGYVAQDQAEGSINYVEYSYALNAHFPVVKLLNASNYYTLPTAQNVAVGLLKATINNDKTSPQYLTQQLEGVYDNPDPRTYALSSYSYMIFPTTTASPFTTAKGKTLGDYAYYFLCEGQQPAADLGYSPLPINLVKAGLSQVARIPGATVKTIDIKKCNNPTFSSDGTNTLAKTAPQPPACDKAGPTQCNTTAAGTSQGSGGGNTNNGNSGGNTSSNNPSSGTGGTSTPTKSTTGTTSTGGKPTTPTTQTTAGGTTDADTGTTTAGGTDPNQRDNVALAAVAVPVTIPVSGAQSTSAVLLALCALLILGIAFVPPILSRYLGKGRDTE